MPQLKSVCVSITPDELGGQPYIPGVHPPALSSTGTPSISTSGPFPVWHTANCFIPCATNIDWNSVHPVLHAVFNPCDFFTFSEGDVFQLRIWIGYCTA